jgi:enamine deaminase RidA (YjgF/YER057c/UK114 family)
MQVTRINLTADASRGMSALSKDGTPAVFSDAVRVDLAECSLLFISGKTAVDEDHKLVGSTMTEQTEQVLKNIKKVLDREGATFDDVVRVRVFTTKIDEKSLHDIHAVRSRYFSKGKYPASTLVQITGLVREAGMIEIEADAVLSKRS